MRIGIIGLGNIGHSLAKGLSISVTEGIVSGFDHNPHVFERTAKELRNVTLMCSEEGVIEKSDLIFVCVRSSQVEKLLLRNLNFLANGKTIVFLSSGIKVGLIKKTLKERKVNIMRAITNVNIASCCGYTIILKGCDDESSSIVTQEFMKLGKVNIVETETQLDTLSLLSGCTPAIVALFFETLIDAGVTIGISKMETTEIIEDTIHQTLKNLKNEKLSPLELRQSVCTPDGVVVGHMKRLEDETDFKEVVGSWIPNILATLQNRLA